MALGGHLGAGCGDSCDSLASTIESKAEECEIEIVSSSSGGDGECTDAQAALADCAIPCYEDTSCEALTGADVEGREIFDDCLKACAGGG